jgi:hypothetical protein
VTLVEVLQDDARRRAVVADGARLVESEVALRSGLSGLAIKAGYKTLKSIRPGVVEQALGMLLPEFAPVLDPFYARGAASGDPAAYFTAHADAIADALLAVTDRRAAASSHGTLRRAYNGLRGTAKREVAASVPALARLIGRHAG